MRRRSACAVILALIGMSACAPTVLPSPDSAASAPPGGLPTPDAPTPSPASAEVAFSELLAANTSPRAVKAVSVGWDVCAIKLDDTLGCWGNVEQPPPSGTYVAVAAGDGSTCAIRTDGRLECWGMIGSEVPDGSFVAVDVGQASACAIGEDRTLTCWTGPDPDNGEPDIKVSHPMRGTFDDVSAGESGICAIRTDGTLACWAGDELELWTIPSGTFTALDLPYAIRTNGELAFVGQGPPQVPEGKFADVSAVEWGPRACARRSDGTLECWGTGGMDDFGNDLPMQTPAGSYLAVSVGPYSACATLPDGRVTCWGEGGGLRPAPTTLISSPLFTRDATETVRWSSIPLFAPVTSYDAEYRTYPEYGAKPQDSEEEPQAEPSMLPWLDATPATSATLPGTPGSTTCVQVRAHDSDGTVSNWAGTCTTFPLDDVAFTVSGDWTRLSDPRFYMGTALASTQRGATLTLTGVDSFGLGLFVTTCPACGTIEWSIDGQPIDDALSLRSAKQVDRALVGWGDNGEEGYAGTLKISLASFGPVIIDGVLLGPSNE